MISLDASNMINAGSKTNTHDLYLQNSHRNVRRTPTRNRTIVFLRFFYNFWWFLSSKFTIFQVIFLVSDFFVINLLSVLNSVLLPEAQPNISR